MSYRNTLVGVIFLLSLVGCNGNPNQLVVSSRPIDAPGVQHPPLPTPVQPINPKVHVITPDVARDMVKQYEAGKISAFALFAFDDQTWLSIGQNLSELREYIEKLRAMVKHYGHPDLQDGQ